MAFYNPSWIRKLLKEDAKNIVDFINQKRNDKYVNDLRDYIDRVLPFVLWLDIGQVETRIIYPNMAIIQNLAEQAYLAGKTVSQEEAEKVKKQGVDALKKLFIQAYKDVINIFIERYGPGISAEQLQEKLNNLQKAEVGKIKAALQSNFGKAFTITTLSKKNTSVMVVFPRFDSYIFNKEFRDCVNKLLESQEYVDGDTAYLDSPARIIKDIFSDKQNSFFTKFQNIGHIEVDVISSKTREVKRGQVSPRLVQALIATPNNNSSLVKVSREFSKQTLQSETRLLVRKRFSGSKLIFEMLVEGGLPVGLPETQEINLKKAAKERAFGPGAGITSEIRKNPLILVDLETSKSIKNYIQDSINSILKSGKQAKDYRKDTVIKDKNSIKIPEYKVTLKTKNTKSATKSTSKRPNIKYLTEQKVSLTDLLLVLNNNLQEQIRKNMGTGSRRDVLNYRTGRFAQSAKVERLSESRQGMITAFYTYMKNPYATFSKGGRQESPASRDPKTLISKSIRELAGPLVSNRMRAVLV